MVSYLFSDVCPLSSLFLTHFALGVSSFLVSHEEQKFINSTHLVVQGEATPPGSSIDLYQKEEAKVTSASAE